MALKWLVNYTTGTFSHIDEGIMHAINTDPSHRGHQIFFQPGAKVVPTQNCFTWGGCVLLAHKDEEAMNSFYFRYYFQL